MHHLLGFPVPVQTHKGVASGEARATPPPEVSVGGTAGVDAASDANENVSEAREDDEIAAPKPSSGADESSGTSV